MKRHTTMLLVALVATLLMIASAGAQKNSAGATALEAAKQKEILNGDLNAAIKQYDAIAKQYAKTDRAVAAMALVRMAEAYSRMGAAESRRIYDRVVKDYPDQTEAVRVARAGLGEASPDGPVSRTVWAPASTPNGATWGALSPDGRFFSHSDGTDLWLHDIATRTDRNLTNRPSDRGAWADRAFESVISPDGKLVAYGGTQTNPDRYDVRLANLTGNPNPRLLYDNADVRDMMATDWSPDGKSLAVLLKKVDRATIQIGLLSVSDGSMRVLKTFGWRGADVSMAFSPDGKYLAYNRSQSEAETAADVFVLAVDGSSEFPVVANPNDDVLVDWSPDGNWLLFCSDRSGARDLWAVAVANGRPQGAPQKLRADIGPNFKAIGWTASNALYYYIRHDSVSSNSVQLASLDWNTGRYASAPPIGTRGHQENVRWPRWSPDGKNLAYVSELRNRTGFESRSLVIRAIDTGKTREMRLNDLDSFSLDRWAPNGLSLFVVGYRKGDPGIYRVDAETADSTLVALFPPENGIPNVAAVLPNGRSFLTRIAGPLPWSVGKAQNATGIYFVDAQTGIFTPFVLDDPSSGSVFPLFIDGKAVYYRRGNDVLIKRDLADGRETELIGRALRGDIHISPDGQYIAASSTDPASNSRVALLIPTAGGEVRELMRVPSGVKPEDLNRVSGANVSVIGWSPDSQSLLLRKGVELWLIALKGGEPKRVIGDSELPVNAETSVSPDGRHFVYRITEPAPPAASEVAILENFLPKTLPAGK